MDRLVSLAFVVVLVCSLPAFGSVGPTEPRPVDSEGDVRTTIDNGTAEWLALADGPSASGADRVAVDVGTTLADDTSRLDGRYERHRLDVRLEAAEADDEQREIIREETEDLSESVAQLRERERTAYTEYYEGERSERALLAELAVVHTRAVALGESIAILEDRAVGLSDTAIEEKIERMSVEARTMQGPVRERVADVSRGEAESTRVHVETDGAGVALAYTDDGRFHREAYRPDNRNPDGATQYASLGQSEERISGLYPSAFADARWSYSDVGYGTHRGVGSHDRGTMTVYLDTATGEVYREHQSLRLDRIETMTVERELNGSVAMTVERTVPGGPASVTLSNAETSEPISEPVDLNDRAIGETDGDGVLWFVAPRDSMTVTATADGTPVEVDISEDSLGQGTARAPADDERS
ncbi:DUF7096 domain-containing protein [Halalkalicoccus subterraneus]|uniref:DUF7096 domain-containing protein n=1 Tax=Halalkalicoccus subterraneus TaxID=2675002 RepID=UPI000EFB1DF3|nr:hypothetical protein [Halalkalicoccus subterraneus]